MSTGGSTVKEVLATIRKYQYERGWTDYQLSERTGIPQSTISSWFCKGAIPTVPSLERVCAAFGITLSQLFAGEEDAVTLTPTQKVLLERWDRLSESQQTAVFQIIDNM